jgi:hypothetical protein
MAIAPSTPVWRYTDLTELEHVLRKRELRLKRVDQFADPFEGSVPKQQIDNQVPIFSSADAMEMMESCTAAQNPWDAPAPPRPFRDRFTLMAIRRKAAARSAHASCWTRAEEIEPRWRLYCNDGAPGQGVAMRAKFERLAASVAHHGLVVRDIQYRRYLVGPAFTEDVAAFLHKREGFRDEEEIRLLNYNEQHKNQLAYALTADGRFGTPPPQPAELPTHIFVGWNALEVLEAIVVSPYATAEYEQRVRAALAAIDPAAASLIALSRFNERSSDPLF